MNFLSFIGPIIKTDLCRVKEKLQHYKGLRHLVGDILGTKRTQKDEILSPEVKRWVFSACLEVGSVAF